MLNDVSRASWLCLLAGGGGLLCHGQLPLNDDFASATPIYGSDITFSGSPTNGTFEAGEPDDTCYYLGNPPGPGAGGSVWWSWTAINSTDVVIELVAPKAGRYGGAFSVHLGNSISNLTHLGCNYVGTPAHRYIDFAATAGITYRIRAAARLERDPGPEQVTLRLLTHSGPIVLEEPHSRTVETDGRAEFHVVAGGGSSRRYQWQFNGQAIPGETNPIVVLHHLQTNQAGGCSVVISNLTGVVTSSVAGLNVLPRSPWPTLTALSVATSNQFYFAVTGGVFPRYYTLESSTNLVQWGGDEKLPGAWYYGYDLNGSYIKYNIYQHTNPASVFAIPLESKQKFLRLGPYVDAEVCAAQLEGIAAAIRLAAIETPLTPDGMVTESDVGRYGSLFACPSGGTIFADSYTVTDVISPPTCVKVYSVHRLPP